MFNTIVACVDFSDVTDEVVSRSTELARGLEAKLVLLHAVGRELLDYGYDPIGGYGTIVTPVYHQTGNPLRPPREGVPPDREGRGSGENSAHHARKRLDAMLPADVDAEARIVEGQDVDSLVAACADLDADLIVIGSHGHGAVFNLIVGSTAQGVIRKAPCPVLVVKTPREKKKQQEG